jgi:D-amino-acid oxidase
LASTDLIYWLFVLIVYRSEEISDASTDDILQRVRDLCPDMVEQQGEALASTYGFDVKQVYVARRPMRKGGLRLERDLLVNDARPSCPLIHCYGAGASGYKISWGAARRVNELVDQISAEIN